MSFKKNTAVTGFPFTLVSTTTGLGLPGLTVAGFFLLDGGTQASIAGAITSEGRGQYSVSLLAAEMNGDIVGLLFDATGAVPASFTIKTDTKIVSELNDFNAASDPVATTTTVTDGAKDATVAKASVTGLEATNLLIKAKTDNLPGTPAAQGDDMGLTLGAVDDIWDEIIAEVTGVPAASPQARAIFGWLLSLTRNEITVTTTTKTFKTDAGATLATKSLSDDGTTYTETEAT